MSSKRDVLSHAARLSEQQQFEEARQYLLTAARSHPDDAEVLYRAAAVHDRLGLEAEAVHFYERCLHGAGLPDDDRRGALLGLGSTYRVLGRYADAVDTLRHGVRLYPDDGALRTFLAMALFNTGEHHEAMRLLLKLLAASSQDTSVREYRRAVDHYADDLEATV